MVEGKNEHGWQLVQSLVDHAIDGKVPLPGFKSAQDLAEEYLNDQKYADDHERVKALIYWETTKNFASGLATGLGGILTLPIAVPAALGASWILQARLAGAIAYIYGHDLREDRVRTLVLSCILGDSAKEVLKGTGVFIGKRMTRVAISKIPGRVLIEINKKIGFRLLTKAGEKGAINLIKAVPLMGGVVSGGFDAVACFIAGNVAVRLFGPSKTATRKVKRGAKKRK